MCGKDNMAKKKVENLSFEEALSELDVIVQQLEQGELSLEDAMSVFERGLGLSQVSQKKLQEAEQKIQMLMTKNGQQTLTPFSAENDA